MGVLEAGPRARETRFLTESSRVRDTSQLELYLLRQSGHRFAVLSATRTAMHWWLLLHNG